MENVLTRNGDGVKKTPLVWSVFRDPKFGWMWMVPRIWLGAQWTKAAQQKIVDPQWMQTGEAFKGLWLNVVQTPVEGPSIGLAWYHAFLQMMLDTQAYTWFARIVAYGELLMGIALMLGAFTGLITLLGSLTYWLFIAAGSASANPMLFVIAVALIMAWKVSGYYGADYYLLQWLGTLFRNVSVKTETQTTDIEALMAWAEGVGKYDRLSE
jgi:thiosulfate dehydrogenase [quinone] large subunit